MAESCARIRPVGMDRWAEGTGVVAEQIRVLIGLGFRLGHESGRPDEPGHWALLRRRATLARRSKPGGVTQGCHSA